MKRLLALLTLSLFLGPPSLAGPQGSLIVLTEEWGPFTFEKNGKAQGFAVDVVEAIQKEIKSNERIHVVPWPRGFHEVQNEPNVILFTVTRTKEREKLFTLLGPIGFCDVTFYGLEKRNLKVNSLEDAKKMFAVAASQDTIFASTLESEGFKNLMLTKNPQQEARLLAAGRVDLIANDPVAVELAFKKIGREHLRIKKYYTYQKGELYIAFSKGTPHAVMEQWKAGLEEIKRNGTYTRLVREWLPESRVLTNVQLVGLESGAPLMN